MKWSAQRQRHALEAGVWKHLHAVRIAWIVDRIRRESRSSAGVFRILDVGCGDAVITKRLRTAFPQADIKAINLDSIRLRRAVRYCPGVAFVKGDVGALPFREATFHVVLCHHVVEHVDDDLRVLAECRRVVRAGGLFILGIPQEDGAIGRFVRTIHRRLYAEGEHVNFYTIATMRERLAGVGFREVEHAKFGFLFPYYYLHVILVWNRLTFTLGHIVSQWCDATADSLMFAARQSDTAPDNATVGGRGTGASQC